MIIKCGSPKEVQTYIKTLLKQYGTNITVKELIKTLNNAY